LTPLESSDKVYEQEFVKGEVAGTRLFLAIPQNIVETSQALLEELKQNTNPEAEE